MSVEDTLKKRLKNRIFRPENALKNDFFRTPKMLPGVFKGRLCHPVSPRRAFAFGGAMPEGRVWLLRIGRSLPKEHAVFSLRKGARERLLPRRNSEIGSPHPRMRRRSKGDMPAGSFQTTRYFEYTRTRPDRQIIREEWILQTVLFPDKEEAQSGGRIRRWRCIPEFENRALRVILLEDGATVHNAFFDRDFNSKPS